MHARFKNQIRLRNVSLLILPYIDERATFRPVDVRNLLAGQERAGTDGNFQDGACFFCRLLSVLKGNGQQLTVNRLATHQGAGDIGNGRCQDQGGEVGKVSGQFQNQEYRCNGGTHAGGNKGGHGCRDDIGTVHGINDTQGNKDIGLNGSHQGTYTIDSLTTVNENGKTIKKEKMKGDAAQEQPVVEDTNMYDLAQAVYLYVMGTTY